MSLIEWQDEILQVMYWMRGESIDVEVSREQLMRFIALDDKQLQDALQALIERNLILAAGERFMLTTAGLTEGKRRFVEEFTPVLGHESHIECDEADCPCHDPGWDAACPRSADSR